MRFSQWRRQSSGKGRFFRLARSRFLLWGHFSRGNAIEDANPGRLDSRIRQISFQVGEVQISLWRQVIVTGIAVFLKERTQRWLEGPACPRKQNLRGNREYRH